MRYFIKQAKEETSFLDSVKTKALNYGLPLVAGAGVYKLSRTPSIRNKIQQLSKGKLFWGTDDLDLLGKTTSSRGGIINKVTNAAKQVYAKGKRWAQFGDIQPIDVSRQKNTKGRFFPGAYYHDTENYPFLGKANIELNTDIDKIKNLFQDKLQFSKLKSRGVIERATSLRKYLEKRVKAPIKTKEDLEKAITKIEPKMYIKPISGYQSKGVHITSEKLKENKLKKIPEQIHKNLDNLLIQRKMNLATTFKGKPKTEIRSHVVIHKGKAYAFPGVSKRWTSQHFLLPNLKSKNPSSEEVRRRVQRIMNLNKNKFKDRSYLFGVDAVRDKAGRIRIFEVNDQSGFLDPTVVADPLAAHKFYKNVTGKDNTPIAAAKAFGTAGITAGAVRLVPTKDKKKKV